MNRKPGKGERSNSPKGRRDPRNSKKPWNKEEDQADAKYSKSSANDVRWYTANGQLTKDTASFNFERRSGDIIQFEGKGTALPTIPLYDPGIMTIYTGPSIGVSNDNTAAVNMAMRDVYSFVRHTNSGHANYDPVDMMLYLLAMDSVYIYWSWMTRLYGILGTFSKTSKYIGDALLLANGVVPSDLRAHYAEFRGYINQFAIEASRYAVPAIFTLFVRHSWMYSNIYRDSNTNRSQLYMYVPAYLYHYVGSSGPGYLQAYPLCCTEGWQYRQITFETIKGIGSTLLQQLATQEDIGIISGDILKAYGEDKLWKLSQISDDYAVIPVYKEEILTQIHNTDFIGTTIGRVEPNAQNPSKYDFIIDFNGLNITQDTGVNRGFLKFMPYIQQAEPAAYSKILDFWQDDVTSDDNMVASRNKMCVVPTMKDIAASGMRIFELYACGSEICTHAAVWYFDLTGAAVYREFWKQPSSNTALGDLAMYSRFNEAPIRMVFNATGTFQALVGTLDKFAMISVDEMKRLHDCALLSMFNIVGR